MLDAALDQAIAAFRGARAVIVDVSNNRGGYDGLAQHIAGRFADDAKARLHQGRLRRAETWSRSRSMSSRPSGRAISARSICSPAT